MAAKLLKVKYQCMHPSCQVFCKKGELVLDETLYNELAGAYEKKELFKSPRSICRMGFSQPFKAVSVVETDEATENAGEAAAEADSCCGEAGHHDPIGVLRAEHRKVLATLDVLSNQVRRRDIPGLWETTAALENDIMLHSVKKEEDALFPLVTRSGVPHASAYMQIMHEDHKEFISLLHSFRCALQEGEILDGIINSVVTNLKNHIKKEEEEFFNMIGDYLDAETSVKLLEAMDRIEAEHVTIEAGNMSEKIVSPYLVNRKQLDAEIAHAKKETTKDDWSCCH
jgi:hemerythrin-like domain-containing protein